VLPHALKQAHADQLAHFATVELHPTGLPRSHCRAHAILAEDLAIALVQLDASAE
jgi:hypothetical protein